MRRRDAADAESAPSEPACRYVWFIVPLDVSLHFATPTRLCLRDDTRRRVPLRRCSPMVRILRHDAEDYRHYVARCAATLYAACAVC